MKITKHNGRSGKHGAYNPKHNDRQFDVEKSEHIDAVRMLDNVYWDYQRGYRYPTQGNKDGISFEKIEMDYYREAYGEYIANQNARYVMKRHPERQRSMKDFILELGKDFTFIDEEYKVQVGGDDFRIDLLFYHRGLQCLVAIELKIGKFKPEYISKLDFYLEALDRQVKKENENPSVGLLLCASKNDEVVEYAMSRTMSPMLVSQYQLQLPDKAVLEKKLQQLVNIPQIED